MFPLAFFYTIFGHSIASFSIEMGLIILVAFLAGLGLLLCVEKSRHQMEPFFSHIQSIQSPAAYYGGGAFVLGDFPSPRWQNRI